MMKWTRLQLNTLPVVAIEADTAIQKLEQLTQRVNAYAHNDDIQALNQLRQSILNRIQALDRFYEKNYLDSSISIFHMIKLKLKKAVFKVEQISNDTMSIELMSQIQKKDSQSMMASNESWYKHGQQLLKSQSYKKKQQNFKIQAKPKSKSKSKIRFKTQFSRLRDDADIDRYEQTNLMEEVNMLQQQKRKMNFNQQKSFEWDHKLNQDQPLFKNNQNQQVTPKKSIKINNRSLSKSKQKIISPFNKKVSKKQTKTPVNRQFKQIDSKNVKNEVNVFKNSNKLATNLKSGKDISSAHLTKKNDRFGTNNTKTLNTSTNANAKKIGLTQDHKTQKHPRSLKTQGQQLNRQSSKNNEDQGQFRFTIKMTKQEYKNLLQMKQLLKNKKIQ